MANPHTIRECWQVGRAALELITKLGLGYGADARHALAKLGVGGIHSPDKLMKCAAIAERWAEQMAAQADDAGMTYRDALALLPLSPSPAEAESAKMDSELAARIEARVKQWDLFLDQYKGGCRGDRFRRAVRDWSLRHAELFSEGKRRVRVENEVLIFDNHAKELESRATRLADLLRTRAKHAAPAARARLLKQAASATRARDAISTARKLMSEEAS